MPRFFEKIFLLPVLLLIFTLTSCTCPFSPEKTAKYSFIVAGHAYGSHTGQNVGLYPDFLAALKRDAGKNISFIIFAGDIVRNSTSEAWAQVDKEMAPFRIPCYFAMGNHDATPAGEEVFRQKFGGTYYSFVKNTEKFIVLNPQDPWGQIPPPQLDFLIQELQGENPKNVFIFIHELIWTANVSKYKKVVNNWGSYNGRFVSNFWQKVFPILIVHPEKNIYIVSGDVGGSSFALPAFYEKLGHITFLATGMGEVPEENYLLVQVDHGTVDLSLKPIDPGIPPPELQKYSLENLK